MSDDEVIKFEITDYDLDNEFSSARGRRQTKESQIYGVWAKDSDDEENEDQIRQRARKAKDYSAPIGFVAGGVQQAGKKKPKDKQETQIAEPKPSVTLDSSDEEAPPPPLPSMVAGLRTRPAPANLGGNVGAWERHTKGIGAKLLLQMGYQPGKGLGKTLQGISAPVEATLRKGRGTIGAYGPEKSTQKAKKEEEKRLKELENEKEAQEKKSYHWKKSHKGRYFYRDAADVIQEGKPTMHTITSDSTLAQVPVIDMTGREKRVLSGYTALRARAPRYEHEPRRQCTNFSAPELTHNLTVLVDCCERDIIQNARELQNAEDEIVVLERDLTQLNTTLQEHDVIISNMEDVMGKVERLSDPELTMENAFLTLEELKELYPEEYDSLNIGKAVGPTAQALTSAMLASWKPIKDPGGPMETFARWKELLDPDVYYNLLRLLLDNIHIAAGQWNPREAAPLRSVFAHCSLPGSLLAESLARSVLPRLLAAVQAWDPTNDTLPLHDWVLPWHDIAACQLSQAIYPLIRSRLAAALTGWHPQDGSARPLLGAWREAWGGALTAFLHQHIVPKLEACLQQAPVELVGNDFSPAWQWCCSWLELLGAPCLAMLAIRALLPRWTAAMAAWLNTQPPHRTALTSYCRAKATFPEEILNEPGIRDYFRKVLDMMNRSADMDVDPSDPIAPPPPRISEPKDLTKLAEVIASTNIPSSFSELLETRCSELGITLVPMVGKSREGRPVYKIGSSMQCYVLRNVVMYSEDSGRSYLPISMDKLLKMAEDD